MTDHDRTTATTETTATPVSTSGITPPTAPPGTARTARPSRVRWLAAGILIALVVGVTALATLVLTGSAPTSAVLGYVPADSVAYGEVRLDLPGDQRQKVGEFLSKFPGFADQAALETKLDEVLDRLVSEGSQGTQTYSADIKPWFGGQLGFAFGPLPTAAAGGPDAAKARGLVLLSVKDATLARTWLTTTLQEAGATGSQESYNGAELTLFDAPEGGGQAAVTIVGDKVALVGDVASVKAAVDTKGSSALAKGEAVTAAQGALTGDDLGFMFVDIKTLFEATTELAGSAAPVPSVPASVAALLPDWTAMRMRVEGDGLRFDAVTQHKPSMPGPDENRVNGVAAFAPPTTVALLSGNDYGATLIEWVELYRDDPALRESMAEVERAAGMLGGLEALLRWMGDTGVVVTGAGDAVEGGVVSIPADAAQGRQLLTTIRTFLQLGGTQSGVTVREEAYAGETITILDLGDLSGLAGMAGALGGVPVEPSGLPDADVELAYVATDEVIAIGSSPAFIKAVLDAGSGASLADDARFQGLVGRVDAQHTGLTFLDMTAIRGLVEGAMADASADEKAHYEESIKPFLTPFDALIATATTGGSTDQVHSIITVK